MAVTLIKTDGVTSQSLEDFQRWAADHRDVAFRMNNRQISYEDVKDGDKVNVIVKASGNR